jgi:hypothetical protein
LVINFTLEPNAGPKLAAYMDRVRAQIVAALRAGMREAMNNLAEYIVSSKLSGNPIGVQAQAGQFTKPGDLAASVLQGVRVGGNEDEVYGTLSGRPKNQPNLGLWQEFGTNHLEQSGKLNVFIGKDGSPVFTRHIAPFSIAPRPFLNPSLREQEAQIVATIRTRLSEAKLA